MAIGGVLHPNNDIAQLSASVDACFDTPLPCLSVTEISNRLVALTNITTRIDALRVAATAAAKTANVGSLNDQRNVANHLAERTNNDPSTTRADQLLALWLVDFPEFTAAHQDGTLTTAHLNLLRRKDNPRVHSQMVDDQPKFIQWFADIAFRNLDAVMERWLLGADPDGAEPKAHAARTGLTLTPLPGGLVKISGTLDPLMGGALKTAITTEAERIQKQHKDAGVHSTLRRRRLEALMLLVTTGFASDTRNIGTPLFNVTVDQRTHEETLDWLADPHNNELPVIDPVPQSGFAGRKCQLADGTPIHPLYAVALSAKAVFRRTVYDARRRPLETSFDSRSFPPWIRNLILIATNGKSANPICDAPFHWLQADHIQPDSLGGPTTLDNARPLSAADNGWRSNNTSRGMWPMPDRAAPEPIIDREKPDLT